MPKRKQEQSLGQRLKNELQKSNARKSEWEIEPSLLLCPNIPKPLHGVAPRVVLGESWWNKERQAAYRSTYFHCKACGVHKLKAASRKWLEGHEVYDIDYQKGLMVYVRTVPLCHFCHNYIHDGRLLWLLRSGNLHQSKYAAIIKHGDKVLKNAGLEKLSRKDRDAAFLEVAKKGLIAPWHKWRLVVDGKRYKPKYKNAEEYALHNPSSLE